MTKWPFIAAMVHGPDFGYSFKFYFGWNAQKGTLERDRVTKVLEDQ